MNEIKTNNTKTKQLESIFHIFYNKYKLDACLLSTVDFYFRLKICESYKNSRTNRRRDNPF